VLVELFQIVIFVPFAAATNPVYVAFAAPMYL
jgi:hypothetical protein